MTKVPPRMRPGIRRLKRLAKAGTKKKSVFTDDDNRTRPMDMDDKLDQDVLHDDKERQEEYLRAFYQDGDVPPALEDAADRAAEQARSGKKEETKDAKDGPSEVAEPTEPKNVDAAERARFAKIDAALQKYAEPQKANRSGPITPPALKGASGGALGLLHNAKEAGVFFKERDAQGNAQGGAGEQPNDQDEKAELDQAVAAVRDELESKKVTGIARVVAGLDEENQPVVLVIVQKGFGQASLSKVPEKMHRFYTILAIPYDLLPLKRDLEAPAA